MKTEVQIVNEKDGGQHPDHWVLILIPVDVPTDQMVGNQLNLVMPPPKEKKEK